MPYGLQKMLEIQAERKKRREEKAKLKAEKEKQKKEEKKKERAKKLKKKRNARAYIKRKKASDEFHKNMGDEKGTFSIYLMKDGKRIKFFGFRKYKVAALQLYHQFLEDNKNEVQFPQRYVKHNSKLKEHKYELILVKKIDENKEDSMTLLRNEEGKFVENYLIDAPTHKILDKNEWFIEETFYVYGFDPQKERKNFSYIYNNIILRDPSTYSRIMVHNNKLIKHYDDDMDIIFCKSTDQAIELYDTIEKMIDKKKNPTLFFMGKISGTTSSWIIDEIQKKTGWTRTKCT